MSCFINVLKIILLVTMFPLSSFAKVGDKGIIEATLVEVNNLDFTHCRYQPQSKYIKSSFFSDDVVIDSEQNEIEVNNNIGNTAFKTNHIYGNVTYVSSLGTQFNIIFKSDGFDYHSRTLECPENVVFRYNKIYKKLTPLIELYKSSSGKLYVGSTYK